MCTVIICFPVYGKINFEINLSFLIKLFFCVNKTSGQKFEYFKNKKSFQDEIKSISHCFKGLSVSRNCFRPESGPLKENGKQQKILSLIWRCSKIHLLLYIWKDCRKCLNLFSSKLEGCTASTKDIFLGIFWAVILQETPGQMPLKNLKSKIQVKPWLQNQNDRRVC